MTFDALKPSILVVDDNAANRAAFTSLLDKDYRVTLAASGREALERAAAQDFAVILLDIRMPNMSGFETATQLRRLERGRSTPIIFLPRRNMPASPRAATEAASWTCSSEW